jgi:hypothetical protein
MACLTIANVGRAGGANLNSQEVAIFNHLSGSGQQRAFLHLDPVLCQVARARAVDMGQRGYYDHTDPSGHGPNWWVEHAGYELPAGYDHSADGNNIESIAAGYTDPDSTWNAWMDSSAHKQHLLATHPFYADQTSVGIGYAKVSGSEWGSYWVVITAPPNGPSLNVSSPSPNAKFTSPQVTLTGTTSGTPAAASVQASVEGGDWVTASGVANWSAPLSGLAPGDNTLHVRSLNAAGGVLDEATRTVRYVVLAPLTLQTTGSGKVTEGFAGTTQREVGRVYKISAMPAPGWLFESWSGGVTDAKATLSFTMAQGLTLSANFIPNPFIAGAGGYSGLFASGDLHGFMRLNLNAAGAFTSRVRYDGGVYVLAGKFDPHGDGTASARLPGGATLTATFHLDTSGASPQVTGALTDGTFTTDFVIEQYDGANSRANLHAGRYTLVLPALDDSTSVTPDGDGIATLKVDSRGGVILSGLLPEGTSINTAGVLTTGGNLALYVPLYRGKGLVTGSLHFRDTGTSDIDGSLFWSKPYRPQSAVCREAFAITTAAIGSRYKRPASGQPALEVAAIANNTILDLGAGDFSTPMKQPATLGTDNSITLEAPMVAGLKVTLQPGSGRFNGVFVHPRTGAKTQFRGIILQKQNAGFGFFLGTQASGYANFVPAGTN